MTEHKRLLSLLKLISLLHSPGGYTIDRLALRFDITSRSVYRYLGILKECGFNVEKKSGRYRIASGQTVSSHIYALTDEEVQVVAESVAAVHHNHPLKLNIIQKLSLFTDVSGIAGLILQAGLSEHISVLSKAIKIRKRVILKQYHSPNSKSVRDRLVEPISFTPNMRYVFAWDVDRGEIRQFKPERISAVDLTNVNCKYIGRGNEHETDIFGMNGYPRVETTLECSHRAILLLNEEFGCGHKMPKPCSEGKNHLNCTRV